MAKTERMAWAEAVKMFGEPALKQGNSHQRVSNWRRDGVPGNITSALFREVHNRELASQQTSRLVDAARTLVSVPPPVMSVIERVQHIWEYSHHGTGIGWHALEAVITSLENHRKPSN